MQVKARFRKMSLKYHPDKNIGREEAAAEVFHFVHAAYHTLTTNNFDYERWAQAFTVPPLQTLEEVLMLALKGEAARSSRVAAVVLVVGAVALVAQPLPRGCSRSPLSKPKSPAPLALAL